MKFIISAAILYATIVPSIALDTWVFRTLDAKLPKAVSDLSGVRYSNNGKIYLAGGCDAETGNVWNPDWKGFDCGSVTDAFFSFDPASASFKTLTDLPRARYRHSSVVVDNKVWILGGRNLTDFLVPEIDVYDIAAGTWSTIGNLPEEYLVSDHASFGKDAAYIAGGYIADYTSKATVVKISADGQNFTEVASLNKARGDIYGTMSSDGTSAFVAGGFNHEAFCQPLATVEKYDFATDTWTNLPDVIDARSEIALAEINNHLYALGGEGPVDPQECENKSYTISTKTEATDRIEILMDGESSWKVLEDFAEERFRFVAVAVPESDVIYSFGGQSAFDPECLCFKTTDTVFVYGAPEDTEKVADDETPTDGSTEGPGGSTEAPEEKDSATAQLGISALSIGAMMLGVFFV